MLLTGAGGGDATMVDGAVMDAAGTDVGGALLGGAAGAVHPTAHASTTPTIATAVVFITAFVFITEFTRPLLPWATDTSADCPRRGDMRAPSGGIGTRAGHPQHSRGGHPGRHRDDRDVPEQQRG